MLDRLDGGARACAAPPTDREDGIRYPGAAWDLRTIIAVFGPDAPFRFLNLNPTLGLTGLPFDRAPRTRSGDPRDVFDLQLCLEGREGAAIYKRQHAVRGEVAFMPGEVRLSLGDRLRFEGRWPRYEVRFRDAEQDLELDLELEAEGAFQRWASLPRIYSHYTMFGRGRLRWRWRGASGELETTVLHDHGFGVRPPALGDPLRSFRYEVLRLADRGTAIGLWTEGPGGVTLRNAGVVARAGELVQTSFACRVEASDAFVDHAGRGRRVPRVWSGRLEADGGTLSYRATRATEPRAVLGDGFLYAFDYEGEATGRLAAAGTGSGTRVIRGEGYAEQMGRAWASERTAPRATSRVGE
jgi:hypothetical protein